MTVQIPDVEGPYKFRRRLKWLPARLKISCNVAAEVTVLELGIVRAANQVFRIDDLKDADAKGARRVSLLVRAQGYLPTTKQVTIVAGEATETRVELEPDEERPSASP